MYNFTHFENVNVNNAIQVKSEILRNVYNYFFNNSFTQIGTPILSFPTKEYGDGEFMVFSKLNPGKCYSLPHSPQLYKQYLIAVLGDKLKGYFQIAKNFRPEVGDTTHAQEFEQIDFEINHGNLDDIIEVIKDVVSICFKIKEIEPSYITVSYDDVIKKYGTDSPDLRFLGGEFEYDEKRQIVGFFIEDKDINQEMLDFYLDVNNGKIKFDKDAGNGFFFYTDFFYNQELGCFRNKLIQNNVIKRKNDWSFVLVKNLPLFVKNGEYLSTFHHPQSAPIEHIDLDTDNIDLESILKLRTKSCDLIINGLEVAGGNVRINDLKLQKSILKIIGKTKEDFNFTYKPLLALLEKYQGYASGGAAIGLDRLTMMIAGCYSLSETQPFPMSNTAEEFFGGPFDLRSEDFLEFSLEKTDKLISKSRNDAFKILNKNGNFVHDTHHVMEVEKNIIKICKNEDLSAVDILALRITAHWHDVGRLDLQEEIEPHELVSVRLFKNWANENIKDNVLIEKVIQVILEHRSKQINLSNNLSLIFQDADKLDVLNVFRVKSILNYYKKVKDKKVSNKFNIFDSLLFWHSVDSSFLNKFKTKKGLYLAKQLFPDFKYFIEKKNNEYIVEGRKFIGLGGGDKTNNKLFYLDKKILENSKNKNILYIPFAVFNIEKLMLDFDVYTKALRDYYLSIDQDVNFDLITLNDSTDTVVEKIKSSEILYFSGGSTSDLIKYLNENTEIKSAIFDAYKKGKYIIGNSAGILAFLETAYSFDTGKLVKYDGLGLLNKDIVIVHRNDSLGNSYLDIKNENKFKDVTILGEDDFCFIFNR